ncbi:hypothetical protein F6Y24_18900 [Xanthomonas arboricola pv. pruni]|nr:hypothetical protein F6Y24_18900 [Xanthomonas arboricola pv. pruni]RST70457.1 hypothetical protein EJK96_08680 [Xanthomonas arboricola pv. pruni]RST74723.1 hypothetical protein EJL05_19240 [Xanthomonas arboricola pv. pruni]
MRALTALFQRTVIVAFGQRHIGMPGVIALGGGQQHRRIGQRIARQGLARLRQQIGQGVLAPFQRIGAVRCQGQDALIQRQRAVRAAIQAPLLLRGHRLCEQGVQPGPTRLQLAQAQCHRCDLRLRHLQRARQRQRALRSSGIPGRNRRARLHNGGGTGARQAGTGFATIAVQRKRSSEQFARAVAIGRAEMAARQRRIAPLQQLLDARVRPQPIGQRLAQHDRGQQETGAQRQHHAP